MSVGFENKPNHSQKSNRHHLHPGQVASIEAMQQSLFETASAQDFHYHNYS